MFTGKFYAGNKKISNLYINHLNEYSVGFFASIGVNSLVKDFIIEDTNIQGEWEVGSIAEQNFGNVINSGLYPDSLCVVNGNKAVGGLIGENIGKIINCYSDTDTSG